MIPTGPEVADVFLKFRTEFLARFAHKLSSQQRRAFSDTVNCRTSALGTHRRRCDACDHEEVSYNSCRNRHCPKCQATKRREWLQREAASLIDVEYFHVVFTLPESLGPIALNNFIPRLRFRTGANSRDDPILLPQITAFDRRRIELHELRIAKKSGHHSNSKTPERSLNCSICRSHW